MNARPEVIIVGAGPTGLALALAAYDNGAHVRILERRRDAFRPSRALIVHPRTLEVLRAYGVVEAIMRRADIAPAVRMHLGRRIVRAQLADLALHDTEFPHLTLVRQAEVESVLAEAVAARGICIERGLDVTSVCQDGEKAEVAGKSESRAFALQADFVVGCDGPNSRVRRAARATWSGKPYREEVVLADLDIEATIDPGVAHAVAGRRGLVFLFPLGEQAPWRLLATLPAGHDSPPFGEAGPPVAAGELQRILDEAGLQARIRSVSWSARYALQHRLASHFRNDRIFLAGDAAHAWSPAVGQGMNTGIQDAANLGWKLGFAERAGDREALLNSYDAERRPADRQVLWLTHAVFWAEASTGFLPSTLRGVVAPLVAPAIPLMLRRRRLVATMLRVVSRLDLSYPRSLVATDQSPVEHGFPRPGNRLPDASVVIDSKPSRLVAAISRPGVHVLLNRDAAPIENGVHSQRVWFHRLQNRPGRGMAAIRPDGYVGLRMSNADVHTLREWLHAIGAA